MKQFNEKPALSRHGQVITYHEKVIGKTLYRVTSVYKGEIDLATALEDLTVRKILKSENASPVSQS